MTYFKQPARRRHSVARGLRACPRRQLAAIPRHRRARAGRRTADLPLTWSATENIAWKTPIPGESWSSPIVWGDRIFVTTATEGGAKCHVLAIDRASGQIVWNTPVFDQSLRRKETRNTYATPTPATDGKRVYACFGDGSFAAVDFAGKVVWINREHPFYSQHGLGSSPVLYRDLLIMAFDGSNDGDDKELGWQKPWDRATSSRSTRRQAGSVGAASAACRASRTARRLSGSTTGGPKSSPRPATCCRASMRRPASDSGPIR